MFAAAGVRAESLDDAGLVPTAEEDDLEVYDTFEGNACAKARWYARRLGRPVVADDSGLVVPALGGRPGVHSKRWSGRADLEGAALDAANNAQLVAAVTPLSDRRAHYVCVAAWSDGTREITARGETHGSLLVAPRGDGGFGYDPYFLSEDLGVTFAEASREAKAAVSHRGRAFRALVDALRAGEA
jgi:XTP/dITP diphosphohydrolase